MITHEIAVKETQVRVSSFVHTRFSSKPIQAKEAACSDEPLQCQYHKLQIIRNHRLIAASLAYRLATTVNANTGEIMYETCNISTRFDLVIDTYRQQSSNLMLILLISVTDFHHGNQLHSWWSGWHQHEREPQHRVISQPGRLQAE
jgi:hypothetical protein